MTVVFLSKENLAIIFTNSEDMIRAVADLAYIFGITMVLSSASQVISGNYLLWDFKPCVLITLCDCTTVLYHQC